jgi:hypothetical protein
MQIMLAIFNSVDLLKVKSTIGNRLKKCCHISWGKFWVLILISSNNMFVFFNQNQQCPRVHKLLIYIHEGKPVKLRSTFWSIYQRGENNGSMHLLYIYNFNSPVFLYNNYNNYIINNKSDKNKF